MGTFSPDTIGRLGEHKFDDLCERAGLIVTTPSPDRSGKDRLVEFQPVQPTGPITFDTRPTPLACWVQIKTLLAKNRRFKMRLSNAERLARETGPTFVAVLRINHNSDFTDLHLIHVDGKLLATILKRLRHEHAKGTKSLNRKTISFSIDDGQKIDITADSLSLAIKAVIGSDMLAYANRKHRSLSEAGYDAARFKLNIGLRPIKIEQLVDGFLGLSDLQVRKFEVFERRFGIALPTLRHTSKADEPPYDILRVRPNAADRCTIIITNSENQCASLDGEFYLPPLPGLEVQYHKAIIRTDLIEFIFYNGGLSFELAPEDVITTKPCLLQTLFQSCRMLKLFYDDKCKVTFQLHKLGREITSPPCSLENLRGDLDWVEPTLDIIHAANVLRQLAGVEDMPIRLGDLIREECEILTAHALMDKPTEDTIISFSTDVPPAAAPPAEGSCIFTRLLTIGGRPYAYAMRGRLTPQIEEEVIHWSCYPHEPLIIEQLNSEPNKSYEAFVDKIARISGISTVLRSYYSGHDEACP